MNRSLPLVSATLSGLLLWICILRCPQLGPFGDFYKYFNYFQRCDFRWVTGEWEGCSRTCGADGTQMRLVYCVRTNMVNATAGSFNWEYGNKFAYFVDQNSTPHEARRHPEVSEENFERETSTVLEETVANPKVDTWKPTIKDFKRKIALENQVTEQSQFKCSVPLTLSTWYFQVLVWHPNAITDPSLCRDQRPEEVQPCNRQPCPGVWVEKFWTKVFDFNNSIKTNWITVQFLKISVQCLAESVNRKCNSLACPKVRPRIEQLQLQLLQNRPLLTKKKKMERHPSVNQPLVTANATELIR